MTQCNNLKAPILFENLKRRGYVRNYQDSNEHGEKGMQSLKNEFISAKGKFAGNLIEKLHSNKIMSHLTNDEHDDPLKKCVLSSCHPKNNNF